MFAIGGVFYTLLFPLHHPLQQNLHVPREGIGVDVDQFALDAGTAFGIEGSRDLTGSAGRNGVFGPIGHGATTGGPAIGDQKGHRSFVDKFKLVFHNSAFRHVAKIKLRFFERNPRQSGGIQRLVGAEGVVDDAGVGAEFFFFAVCVCCVIFAGEKRKTVAANDQRKCFMIVCYLLLVVRLQGYKVAGLWLKLE